MQGFGAWLRTAREARNLSQVALAVRLRVDPQAISRWERDENKPNPERVERLAKFFREDYDWLLALSRGKLIPKPTAEAPGRGLPQDVEVIASIYASDAQLPLTEWVARLVLWFHTREPALKRIVSSELAKHGGGRINGGHFVETEDGRLNQE